MDTKQIKADEFVLIADSAYMVIHVDETKNQVLIDTGDWISAEDIQKKLNKKDIEWNPM